MPLLIYGTVLIDPDLGGQFQYGYRDLTRYARNQRLLPPRTPALCHPTRDHVAHGLCARCYQLERKERR